VLGLFARHSPNFAVGSRSVDKQDVTGVWKLAVGQDEELLLKLTASGVSLTGEVSSRRIGTIQIHDVTVSDDVLSWVVPVRTPVEVEIEFVVRVDDDGLAGESRAGSYGTSVVNGRRGTVENWVLWDAPHVHRSAVRLPDGTEVIGVSYDADNPYGRVRQPDFGLYLDRRWAPPWPHDHLAWPDFGLPPEPDVARLGLNSLLDRARGGQRVEIGCLGGHGRTGTALAWLAQLTGEPSESAVSWVRAHYCPFAVETLQQENFIAQLR
jgi:hypothetical protein